MAIRYLDLAWDAIDAALEGGEEQPQAPQLFAIPEPRRHVGSQHWWELAKEARAIADLLCNPGIAEDYARLGQRAAEASFTSAVILSIAGVSCLDYFFVVVAGSAVAASGSSGRRSG